MADANAQMVAVNAAGEDAARSMEEHHAWPMISHLPVTLGVRIPLHHFKVGDLLKLRSGQTIESRWAVTEDVPLKVGVLPVSRGEFEVVEDRMALRLTRLA
jgi:flagellar motor switch protein FliN/FliY